jgi:hypothetical protein
MLKRELMFQDGDYYHDNQQELDRWVMRGNTTASWLRSIFARNQQD